MSTQRIIRKLPSRKSTAVDDRPATAQWMLAIWAGLLTVLVVVLAGFDDTRLLHNGWFRLMGVGVTWGLLAWAAATPGNWMAQRLRLATAASLALHTLLALVLVFANLTFSLSELEPDIDRQVVVEPTEVPKQVEIKRPVPSDEPVFEKPMPTDRLAAVEQPPASPAKVTSSEPVELSAEPPELSSSDVPQSLARRQPRTALAHRAKQPGRRSRQAEVATLATTATESIQRPKQLAATRTAEPSPAAKVAKAADASEPNSPQEPRLDSVAQPRQVADRSNSDAPRIAQTAPAPRRRQSPAEVMEPALAEVAPNVTTPDTNRLVAEPTRLERPKADFPTPRDLSEPQLVRDVPPTPIARRDTRDQELPLAASPTPLDRRQTVSVAEAVATTPQTRTLADVTRTESTITRMNEPVATNLNRALAAANIPDETVDADTFEQLRPVANAPDTRSRDRAPAMETPVLAQLPRTVAEATLSTPESLPDPMVAAVPRAATQQQSSSPAPRVLADSRGGTGMQGNGLNSINDSPAAPTYSAPFATAAAKRNHSTQTERGPALAPNPVASVARSRASATLPTSTLVAQPIPDAKVAGSTTPEAVNASSSAAIEKQFANVTLGDVTAARGEAEFDTGPPQIAPERGTGRGAMGGRLAIQSPQTQSGLGPRRLAEAALSTAATTLAATPQPPAAAASGGGAVAIDESRTGGAEQPSTAGRPAPVNLPKLVQSRAPAGAVSGGGATPPSIGPPAAAIEVGTPPPRAGGSMARRRNPMGSGAGPMPSIASGDRAPPRTIATAAGVAAAAASAVDPVASVLVTPLAVDLARSTPSAASPATASATDIAPKRRALLPADLAEGGIGSEPALDAGVPQRIARRQTTALRMSPSRFANRSEGGELTPPGRKRNPAPAFATRTDRLDSSPITSPSDPSPKTEAAIELGLEFLAKLQQDDGRWSLGELNNLPIDDDERATMTADGAATGMALLAFLGGGYDHYDDKYQAVVQRGLGYLIDQQSDEGDIFPERENPSSKLRFYSHGIAALALCEAYGMTGDPELRESAQAALDYIMRTQHPQLHAWRYLPGQDADLSVAGWQMMALRSGELAGLRVDRQTYQRMATFLEQCRIESRDSTTYCYNPYRTDVARYGRPSTVMTAVGMLMELYLGETRESVRVQQAARQLANNLPTHPDRYTMAPVGTNSNPQRDTYYWYYATQVMFHMGGDHWQQWHDHLYPLLIDGQTQEGQLAGSWSPRLPVPDRYGALGGRLYVTCLNLLSLEVSYRHLPLYEMTGQQ